MKSKPEPLVKAKEVMELLGVGKTKIYDLIAVDCLPYYNLATSTEARPDYRFRISEIESWMKQRKAYRK